ncbi:hypothetical protein SARC_01192 [Sphaeroforma arctica JP610]|uniref:Uncharacterized protein n=1 Tax=Sphaeroforma arctica JP610 TaxID=667725 RepID=A0A0L0GCD0_9EUKA|nr:hypothetical protein SARC_01192 [Sphaeroforma arctica JP610]KNC86655.1 hypothetical protein SARC_01192 [Sphaeroforma arctica JP610]|eukprot:XP_014160557.1 hypothetical protein SARC_01192 [Sphaeroforma arctica JP610]
MDETMEEAHPYVVFPGMIPPAYLASQLPFPAPLPLDGPGVGAPSTSIHSILRNDAHVTPHSLAVVGDMLASVHARTNGLRMPNAVPFSGVNAKSASTPRVISAVMQKRPGVLNAIARERNTEVRGMQRNSTHTNQMSTDQSSHLSHENVHVQQSQRQNYQQQRQHPQMKQEGGSHRDMQQVQPQKQQQQHGSSAGPHSRYNNGGKTTAGESGYRPSSAGYRGSHTSTHNQTHAHAHHQTQNYSNSTTNTHASAPVHSENNMSLKHDPNNPRVIHTVKQERPPQPHDRHSHGVHAPAVRSEVLEHTNTHAKHHKYPRDSGSACMLGAIREQQGVSPGYGPSPVPITIPPELEQVTAEFRPANAYVENHAPHKQVHSAHGAREGVQPVDKEEEGRQVLQKGLKRDQAHMKGTHQTPQKPSKSAKLSRRTSSSKKRDANFDGTRSGESTPRKPPQEKTHVRDNTTPGSKNFGSIKKRVEAIISSDSMRYAETGDMTDFRSLPRKSLTELRLQLTLQSAVLHRIAMDDLSQLVYLMDRHITAKREVKLNSDSPDHNFEEVLVGLEAAHIILTLVTAPSIPIEIYIEDYLTNALHFVKHHITKTLFRPHHNTDASEPKQSKKKSNANSAPKISAHAQRQISTLYTRLCVVMERFCNLLSLQNCTDEFLLEITTLALNSFTYAPDDLCVRTIDLAELQGISLHLVCTVTRRYHRHRENVMYDILMFLNKLTTAKKNLRTFRASGTQALSLPTLIHEWKETRCTSAGVANYTRIIYKTRQTPLHKADM